MAAFVTAALQLVCRKSKREVRGLRFDYLGRAGRLCQSEVQEVDVACGQNEDVPWFDVSVQDPFLVRGT